MALALVPLVAAPAAHAETCDAPGQIPPFRECDTSPPRADFEISGNTFRSLSKANPDRQLVREEWDFDSDGTFDATGREVQRDLPPGYYKITLHVVDDHGDQASASKSWSVAAPQPQSVELSAEKLDLVWPNQVQLRGRVVPAEAGVKEIYLESQRLKPPSYDDGHAIYRVPVAADGTFSFTQRFPGNTRFTAWPSVPGTSYDQIKSAPVTVYIGWRAQSGWNRLRGSLVEAGFVVRPAEASVQLEGRLFYFYWHRPGSKWMRRVAHGRVRLSRTSHAVGYTRFHVRRPGRRDSSYFCIRGEGSDGWGRPSSAYDLTCGLRRLRW